MARLLLVLLLAVPCVALGQAKCATSPSEIAALRELLKQDPLRLAQAAVSKKDNAFLAVAGFSVVVPGVDGPSCSVDPSQTRVMPGTTDFLCNSEHGELVDRAYIFAEKYNSYLKQTFYRKGGIKCLG
jgi:hypothetical protein